MLIKIIERGSLSPGHASPILGREGVLYTSCADPCMKLNLIAFLRASYLQSAMFVGLERLKDEGDVSSK